MIQVRARRRVGSGVYCYCIAGRSLICDIPLPLLHPFRSSHLAEISFFDSKAPVSFQDGFVSRGTHWVGGRDRQVEMRAGGNHFRIEMEGIARFVIQSDGSSMDIQSPGCADDVLAEAILGPPLILCLALRGVFCLHASAVKFDDHVTAFLGQSGAGKSTIGKYWAPSGSAKGRRICDDVLPVEFSPGSVYVLPHFPQLKYGIEHQYPLSEPDKLRLSDAYLLSPDETAQNVEVIPMSSREAALALLGHTVGSRLLNSSILAEHWNFCLRAAGVLKIARLRYPQKIEVLAEIEDFLLRQISA